MSGQAQDIPLADPVVIGLVAEGQRQNACIDQIGHMDAGKRFHDNGLDPQVQGSQRRVFAGAALSVVGAADNDALALLFAPGREVRVTAHEAVLRNGRDVGAKRQDLSARRHDVVGW